MDASAFYTRTAATGDTSRAAVLSGSGKGKATAGGIDAFLDLLLSTINPAGIAATGKNAGAQGSSATDGKSLKDLLATLPADASAQDILAALKKAGIQDATIAQFLAGAESDSTLKAKDDALDIIRDILDGASQDDLAAISALLTANDNAPADAGTALTVSKKDILDTLDNLVASGLTPEQISALAEKLRALKGEKGEAMDAAFLASLLGQNQTTSTENAQTLSAAESDTRALLARALAAGKTGTQTKSGDAAKPTANDLIAALNGALEKKNLIGPAPEPVATGEENPLLSTDAGDTKGKMISFAGGPETLVPRAQTQGHAANLANGLGASGNAAATDGAQPLLSASAGWSAGEESFQDWLDRVSGTSALASSGQSLTAAGTTATTPTLAGGGVQTASQVVAAAIFRAAQGGEARTMTLHLDPPELGRVAIRLEMDKNRTLKTVLTIEKPETHSLLQRDAHLLERALQNAGIDTSGGESLNFELAGEGFSFDRGGGQNGGQGSGGTQNGTENAGILETRMDWYVDPDTGLRRYDIIA